MESLIDNHSSSFLFKWICLAQIVVYIEAGAVPALLNELREQFNMSFPEQGALGGVVYLFLSAACPLASWLLKKYSVKHVMATALVFNMLSVLLFSLTPSGHAYLLIAARATIGFTQAFLMVFNPVWVDEFAPPSKRGAWMSFLQASVPIGIMIGYLLATISTWPPDCWFACWRLPFFIQTALTLPLALAAFFVPTEHLDLNMHRFQREIRETIAQHIAEAQGEELDRRLEHGFNTSLLYPSHVSSLPSAPAPAPVTSPTGDDVYEDTPLFDDRGSPVASDSLLAASNASAAAAAAAAASGISPSGEDLPSLSSDSAASAGAAATGVTASAGSLPNTPGGGGGGSVSRRKRTKSVAAGQAMGLSQALLRLFANPVYTFTVLALSGLYFVVTGVQFWATDFLITVIGGDKNLVRLLFIVTSATAPLLGVFVGGYIIDKQGGYQGATETANALRTCTIFGGIASCFSIPCTYLNDLYSVVAFMWLLLFWGGALLPAATGVMISAVNADMRPFASSISVICFNLLGYFLSPIVSGFVMGLTNDFRIGFRMVLFVCGFSMLMLLCAWYGGWRKARHHDNAQSFVIEQSSVPAFRADKGLGGGGRSRGSAGGGSGGGASAAGSYQSLAVSERSPLSGKSKSYGSSSGGNG